MRIALGIEYDGSRYYGWQRQQEVDSVQARLEAAISKVADSPTEVFCAGRTDAGVHATGQVVHFDTQAERGNGAWTLGLNANLPDDVAVRWAQPVSDDFHARFSATARRYRYVIVNQPFRPGVLRHGVTHWHRPLDENAMHRAAQALLGEQDFTSFRAIQCQSNTPFRNVMAVSVGRFNQYVVVDIEANAFLHHMVRNIVGTLLKVGSGELAESAVSQLLALRDRSQAPATAPANGLYLVAVRYPEHFAITTAAPGPLFLPDPLS
ncbi:tRNA pseudouridine(38-40) synthase TruA [Gallaecimonas sp. GXIMD1310]|uniref:tRNA pseudouridine(38-40) synthase TruA n=1 Tax=Gallaecimonas sp. GXIMD1310 TaxID=3131926 RepID=UPI003246053E